MKYTADEIINAIARIMDPDIWAASDQPFSEPTLMFDREVSTDRAKSVYAVCLRMLREPTREMMDAWGTAYPDTAPFTDDDCATADWYAMLDERIWELG